VKRQVVLRAGICAFGASLARVARVIERGHLAATRPSIALRASFDFVVIGGGHLAYGHQGVI